MNYLFSGKWHSDYSAYFETYLNESGSDTIGGLISQTLGHIPQRDESVQIDQVRFEIVHADSRRLHLVRVASGGLPNRRCLRQTAGPHQVSDIA